MRHSSAAKVDLSDLDAAPRCRKLRAGLSLKLIILNLSIFNKLFSTIFIAFLDIPENVSDFVQDVETIMECSSHREFAFKQEWNRSLNVVVFGPFWLRFEPCGAFGKMFGKTLFPAGFEHF